MRQVDYDCGRPIIFTIDTSPIAIGWAIGQDDAKEKKFAIKFRARILIERQRKYPQVKWELLEVLLSMKAYINYFIGTNVVLETDYLSLLDMIANYSTPDIAMLR